MPRKKVDTKNKTLKDYTVFTAKDEIERDFGKIFLFSTKYDLEGKKIKRHFENHHVIYSYYDLEKEENKKKLEELFKKNKYEYEEYKNITPIVIINEEKILVQPKIEEINKALLIEDTQARELYDLIIVGGGISGFFTALHSELLGLKTIIIEEKTLLYRLENIPYVYFLSYNDGLEGRELSLRLNYDFEKTNIKLIEGSYAKRLKKLGDLYEVSTEGAIYRSKTVLLALGAKYLKLNVFGEQKFYNKGLYYSDEYYNHAKDKEIGIAGVGKKIYEDALLLSEKAKKITLFDLNKEETKLSSIMKKKLEEKNIRILKNIKILEFRGEEYLEEVKYHDYEKNKNYILPFNSFFVILKNEHENQWLKTIIELEEGKIKTKNYETNLKGVFAIGNCTKDYYKEYKTALQESGYIIKKIQHYLKEWKQKEKKV